MIFIVLQASRVDSGTFAILTGAAPLSSFGKAPSALIVLGGLDEEQRDDDVPVSPPRRCGVAPGMGLRGASGIHVAGILWSGLCAAPGAPRPWVSGSIPVEGRIVLQEISQTRYLDRGSDKPAAGALFLSNAAVTGRNAGARPRSDAACSARLPNPLNEKATSGLAV